MRRALITGVCGQSGAYLAKLLISKGYAVYGFAKPRTPRTNLNKLGVKGVTIIEGDLTDASSVAMAIRVSQPDEIYNLAAQSHVGYSFKTPEATCAVNYTGYLNVLLEARRIVPKARIYQAGTSEMFGYAAHGTEYQSEATPFQPMSPYAISKVAAHWAGVNARYEADQFVANGILFNHESPLREIGFVTKKITDAVTTGKMLRLGNIDSCRDWGFAGDYVEAMWLMLHHDKPDDFVVATGDRHTVREFVKAAFEADGKTIEFDGQGTKEKGYVDDVLVMEIADEFYRPNDLSFLCGNADKARDVLGWKPVVSFNSLVRMMVEND